MSIKFEGEVKINCLSEEKCGYLRLNIKNRETLFNQAETVFFFSRMHAPFSSKLLWYCLQWKWLTVE